MSDTPLPDAGPRPDDQHHREGPPTVDLAGPAGTATLSPVVATAPAAPSPDVPRQIGRFEIRRLVGEGGFGRVYEAFDPSLKRTVALKVARHEQMADEQRAERFQREARAAGGLTHPNIVAVYDSGREGPHHYIASAFVAGQALEEQIEGRGAFPEREAAEIARKLAEALAYAHRQGVVHRDVKPGNVMLRQDGEPLLTDFGLAARADEAKLTVEGQVMGTAAYCAPEQWRGEATAASDQYSVGCVLFELLTGQKPYAGRDIGHYLALHMQAPVPGVAGVSRDLEAIVQKCLEKEPERRYGGCQELADDLGRWLRSEPTRARPVGPLGRLWRWAKREPATASLVGAVALLLVFSSALSWGLVSWALGEKSRADGEAELKAYEAGLKDREALAARQAEKLAKQN